MKFQKAITMDATLYEAVIRGTIKLQCGQWVRLDGQGRPSRFVAAHASYLCIVHPAGPFATGPFPRHTFAARCEALRSRKRSLAGGVAR